jgi:hypothetical protein
MNCIMGEFANIASPAEFCRKAVERLAVAADFPGDYVSLKILFFHRFQRGLVFSTRFGGDFFAQTLRLLESGELLQPAPGQAALGEYDENFNRWLRLVRRRN